ncbi:MAG: PD-(D/E)XK nuclease family protein [Candidatus Adiutrix sp.]|nr:PD-(D/E)XK nuclease family protein [Candidatus Adiutrix sp.]
MPLAALEPDGEARARVLTGFLAVSRTLGRPTGPAGLSPAEELAELARNQGGRSGLEYQGEAVTLSTIHAAKGLEFPVVIIAESDSPPRVRPPRLLISGDGRLALNWRPAGWPTPPASYLELAAEEDRLDKMENQRLFYVAATRARDHLVFLGRPKSTGEAGEKAGNDADTWFQAVLNCPEAAALSEELVLDPAEFSASPGPAEGTASPTRTLGRGETLNLLKPMTLNGASLSATELAHWLAAPGGALGRPGPEASAGASLSAVSGLPAAPEILNPREAGLLFHAVMEILDPREPHPRELLAAEAARLGFSPEAAAPLAGPIEAFLDSPWGRAFSQAASAGRAVFREWPFQLRLLERGGQARHLKVNGVIDLFFKTPDGGLLVDYKFAALPGGGEPSHLPAYENQVRLYALALRSAGLAGNLKAALYFAGGSRPGFHEVNLETGWPREFWEDFFNNFFNKVQASRLRL